MRTPTRRIQGLLQAAGLSFYSLPSRVPGWFSGEVGRLMLGSLAAGADAGPPVARVAVAEVNTDDEDQVLDTAREIVRACRFIRDAETRPGDEGTEASSIGGHARAVKSSRVGQPFWPATEIVPLIACHDPLPETLARRIVNVGVKPDGGGPVDEDPEPVGLLHQDGLAILRPPNLVVLRSCGGSFLDACLTGRAFSEDASGSTSRTTVTGLPRRVASNERNTGVAYLRTSAGLLEPVRGRIVRAIAELSPTNNEPMSDGDFFELSRISPDSLPSSAAARLVCGLALRTGAGRQSVYDTLGTLVNASIIRRRRDGSIVFTPEGRRRLLALTVAGGAEDTFPGDDDTVEALLPGRKTYNTDVQAPCVWTVPERGDRQQFLHSLANNALQMPLSGLSLRSPGSRKQHARSATAQDKDAANVSGRQRVALTGFAGADALISNLGVSDPPPDVPLRLLALAGEPLLSCVEDPARAREEADSLERLVGIMGLTLLDRDSASGRGQEKKGLIALHAVPDAGYMMGAEPVGLSETARADGGADTGAGKIPVASAFQVAVDLASLRREFPTLTDSGERRGEERILAGTATMLELLLELL